MPDSPSAPKDVADMLDALAKRIRTNPSFLQGAPTTAPYLAGLSTNVEVEEEEDGPHLGAVDMFRDASAVTVTIETRNADARSVHVSIADGRLVVGVGQGPGALKKDVALPVAVDEDAAFATFRNGILDVVLPLRGTVKR